MIVKMLHIDLLCVAKERDAALEHLRELGAVHLETSSAEGECVKSARGDYADAEAAVRAILKARGKNSPKSLVRRLVGEVTDLQKKLEAERAEAESLSREIAEYEPYGDFDPALAEKLLGMGINFDGIAELPEVLPRKRLSALKYDLAAVQASAAKTASELAKSDEAAILETCPGLDDAIQFAIARESMQEEGEVAVISGWIPAPGSDKAREMAEKNGMGVLLREAAPDENPPTLVRPPKAFSSMTALFSGLGVSPAYTEADVSVPFMCYFSLFFAMLVGDGGYGALILALVACGWIKAGRKAVARPWLVLMTVFSVSTIIWGFLSDTWFGSHVLLKAAGANGAEILVPRWDCVSSLAKPALWLGDPSYHTMMFLCFTIGVSHLVLARIWNAVCMANSLVALGQIGWAGILFCMYWITCGIVGIFQGPVSAEAAAAIAPAARVLANIPKTPCWFYPVFGVSIALVFLFSVPFKELKTRGAELGMLPLNIMSALGDIISYVRLFAVGLASVQVAVNFNRMALDLISPEHAMWQNALLSLGTLLILLVGHGLNFAMAGLSVLVHAVRLNTLEFSNHKGVSWSGRIFNPFRKHK